jgi:hypothetical protein
MSAEKAIAPRRRKQPVEKAPRVRISLRLEATVCKKLDQLAKLRGLDRNTAISVALVQDWLASIGTDRPELDQEPGSMKEGGENAAWKKIR